MALANRLVGNASSVPALETTLTGVRLEFGAETTVAVTGAAADCSLNDDSVGQHTTIPVRRGDVLAVGPATAGVRNYVAVSGGLRADDFLGSFSTYLPAGLGGFDGRALRRGDELELRGAGRDAPPLQTPLNFRPPVSQTWTLRACRASETHELRNADDLFRTALRVSNRSDRMGIRVQGVAFAVAPTDDDRPSAPVFPGTVQCPGDGSLFILSVDAQTTGGYPRVAKIARLDMHLLGQLKPGDSLKLLERREEDAGDELREKHAYWRDWLPDVEAVI